MTELQVKLLAVVDANNGVANWHQLVDAVEYPERQKVLPALRDLENQGLVKRATVLDPNTHKGLVTVSKVG